MAKNQNPSLRQWRYNMLYQQLVLCTYRKFMPDQLPVHVFKTNSPVHVSFFVYQTGTQKSLYDTWIPVKTIIYSDQQFKRIEWSKNQKMLLPREFLTFQSGRTKQGWRTQQFYRSSLFSAAITMHDEPMMPVMASQSPVLELEVSTGCT